MHSSQTTANPGSTSLKSEPAKLPSTQASHVGNVPPPRPPTKVATAATPEDPEGNRGQNLQLPVRYTATMLHPSLPPALVPISHTKKNTANPTTEPSLLDKLNTPILNPINSWLTVGAIGASTFALSSYLFNANLVHSSSNLTYVGYALFAAGATTTIGLTARLLGLFSGSKTQ